MLRKTHIKRSIRFSIGCLLLIAAASTPTGAQEVQVPVDTAVAHDRRFDNVRNMILERVADDIPSFAVSVIHRGDILWEEAFGWADIATATAVTADTPYSIASVAKSITATGVMLLAQEGRLDIDNTIDVYLGPEIITPLASSKQTATVRDLLKMTAGFPMGYKAVYESNQAPSPADLFLDHGGIQVFAPGEVFHYSNFSIGLAEIVVEKATGEPFSQAMHKTLFGPASMESTFYSGSPNPGVPVVTNYEEDGTPWPAHTSMPAGGAGINSSVSDLRRYALAQLGSPRSANPIIPEAVRKVLHGDIAKGSDGMFAVGWWVMDLGDDKRVIVSDGHGAGMALVQLIPDEQLAVVCLMNTRKMDVDGHALTNKVANRVIEELIPGFSSTYERFRQQLTETSDSNKAYQATPDLIGAWDGYVRHYDGSRTELELLVQPDGDIHITLQDQYTVLLTEARFSYGVLEAWFPGLLKVDVQNDHMHDILARIRFQDDQAHGYLNANFYNDTGVYDLPSYLFLQRRPATLQDTPN